MTNMLHRKLKYIYVLENCIYLNVANKLYAIIPTVIKNRSYKFIHAFMTKVYIKIIEYEKF